MYRAFCLLSLMVLSIATLSGCSQSHSKLSGDWGITAGDRLAQKLGESATTTNLEASDEEPSAPKMVLQFRSNGMLKTTTKMGRVDPPPKEGRWKMLSWDDSQQLMKIECKLADQTTEHEVKFLEEDLIELIPPNMAGTHSRVKFRRMK